MSGTGTTLSRRTFWAVAAAVSAVGWGCKPKVDEKKLRKIVREELDRALGKQKKEGRKPPQNASRKAPRKGATGPNKNVPGQITKIGPKKYQIPRSYFTGFMIRSSRLASGARIIPWIRDGALKGFRLYAIRPGSPWSLMGFQNGDIIVKVDGKEITSSEKMLSIFTGVATANQMKLEVVRRGKTITFTYIIK